MDQGDVIRGLSTPRLDDSRGSKEKNKKKQRCTEREFLFLDNFLLSKTRRGTSTPYLLRHRREQGRATARHSQLRLLKGKTALKCLDIPHSRALLNSSASCIQPRFKQLLQSHPSHRNHIATQTTRASARLINNPSWASSQRSSWCSSPFCVCIRPLFTITQRKLLTLSSPTYRRLHRRGMRC